MEGWGIGLQPNRQGLWIKLNVCSTICLFTESGKASSPYNYSCNINSFARSTGCPKKRLTMLNLD